MNSLRLVNQAGYVYLSVLSGTAEILWFDTHLYLCYTTPMRYTGYTYFYFMFTGRTLCALSGAVDE